jgi:hypothetical protein
MWIGSFKSPAQSMNIQPLAAFASTKCSPELPGGHSQKQRWARSLEREGCSKLNNSRLACGRLLAEGIAVDARVKSSELECD